MAASRARARWLGVLLSGALLLLAVIAAPAGAAPAVHVTAEHGPSIVPPGGELELAITIRNSGDEPTAGPITVHAAMPPGLKVTKASDQIAELFGIKLWKCTIAADGGAVDCVGPQGVAAGKIGPAEEACETIGFLCRLLITVSADSTVAGQGKIDVEACGGGGGCASDHDPVPYGPGPKFSLLEWDGDWAVDASGDAFTQAGGHPYSIVNTFDLTAHRSVPDAGLRNVWVELPAGFVGAINATPACNGMKELRPESDVTVETKCPPDSIVGMIIVRWMGSQRGGAKMFVSPIFNMKPPPGQPAAFGIRAPAGQATMLTASLRSDSDFGIELRQRNLSQGLPVTGGTTIFWGNPADPRHDFERCVGILEGTPLHRCGTPFLPPPSSYTSGLPKAFLTNPTSCSPPGVGKPLGLKVESWEQPSRFDSATFFHHVPGDPSTPVATEGCDVVPFDPDITVQPSSNQADTPTGLEVRMTVPTEGLENPDGISQSNLEQAVIRFPRGMTVNPSYADGLAVCTPGQIGLTGTNPPRFDREEPTCPEASKIGTVRIETPLINFPLEGELIAGQSNDPDLPGPENPFDSLVGLYVVARAPGVIVKLAGQVTLDPRTGQLTTSFDEAPQVPFSRFVLKFKGGPRAPLVNPATCGTYVTQAELTPWARPDQPVPDSDPFTIARSADGAACPTDPGARPFRPVLQAGTLSPIAGDFTPFILRMTRNDGEQEITSFASDLAPGIFGKLAGVPRCPDAALAAAVARTGRAERANPSCPAASRLGAVLAGTGSGQILSYIPGSAYLAGPYDGAPLSVATVVPATLGPFDIGTIVVRAALRIDRDDVQVHVDPVPIPYIRDGIALHVRDIRLQLDRDNFILNPTNCRPRAIGALMRGTGADFATPVDDVPVALSDPFRVADCAALGFKPRFDFRLKGKTRRGAYPAFSATVRARPGDANIARAQITLPRSEFLDVQHIGTVCTRVQFANEKCPPASVYGRARALSPLIDGALEGPVYLRSSDHVLPDLVVALGGEFDVDLVGRVDSHKESIRTTFDSLPDAPISKFTFALAGGRKSLLTNSVNLCSDPARVDVRILGQNGTRAHLRPLLANDCDKQGKRKRSKRPGRG